MDKFYRIPIPIDHTATTKPRRKAKAKRKGKARMVTGWACVHQWTNVVGDSFTHIAANTSRAAIRTFARSYVNTGHRIGPITRIRLPAPAVKGGGT